MVTSLDVPDLQLLAAFASVLIFVGAISTARRTQSASTRLRSPQSDSLIWGVSQKLPPSKEATEHYARWEAEYGPVYRVPYTLGMDRIVLLDAKAVAHFFAVDNAVYVRTEFKRNTLRYLVGEGVVVAEGDAHRRQRKVLMPAFSNAAIRALNPIFYDCAYKASYAVTSAHVIHSIDSIGLGGFSHDFRSLEGEKPIVAKMFDADDASSSFFNMLPTLGLFFPVLHKLPGQSKQKAKRLGECLKDIADKVWEEAKKGEGSESIADNSVLGRLLRAEGSEAGLQLSKKEVLDDISVLVSAGYITTSTTLTWALIELAKHPEVQKKLRDELAKYDGERPLYDELMGSVKLPYLDAVTHETLRLHPAATEIERVAIKDDIIPLSMPITTASGSTTDHVIVPRGTLVAIPIAAINRSPRFWGDDAASFRPDRWLGGDADSGPAKELVGHRHLLTFANGPRTCIGKGFWNPARGGEH
ncbi:cytochrome P450 [Coniophora puteana RWD-64-598 SS2]|uniref:Cytochrome P450 n=1 Tax=Coniophora puteana (strain RWD-64-598) TaxID=741705 RepID=A0A5M3MHD6_CONPW|nr:cytochrome P450 [Coniophora puteana RWD-64-598 SS2]EIW78045.1 cytochrome P450 [Coniophora puteana RWD-64-598 SS2]